MTLNQIFTLPGIYNTLLEYFGKRNWWKAESGFEIMIGSILVQNTHWSNAEKGIRNIRRSCLLDPERLYQMPLEKLRDLIKPAGLYNQKARRIRAFLEYYKTIYNFKIDEMTKQDSQILRIELLEIYGIGEETADSILLYALNKPYFVVDKYTRRIFFRIGLIEEKIKYNELSAYFMQNLPGDLTVYKGFHKLIIYHGREFCRSSAPRCGICILRSRCEYFALKKP